MQQLWYRLLYNKIYIPWLGYYLLIVLKRWDLGWWILAWVIGGILSIGFILSDRLISILVLHQDSATAHELKDLLRRDQFKQAILMLWKDQQQYQLMGLSIVFLFIWLPLTLFLLTSSPSWFAKGLIMGIGLRAVLHILKYWHSPEFLKHTFFWQIKRDLTDSEVKITLSIFTGLFILLSLMV